MLQAAREARNGFHQGVVRGLIGMGLAGLTNGRLSLAAKIRPAHKQIETLKKFYSRRLRPEQLAKLKHEAATGGRALHDALMDACGWPEIPLRRQTAGLASGRAADGRKGAGGWPALPIM